MRLRTFVVTLVVVLALGACGDDDGTGGRYSDDLRSLYMERCTPSQGEAFCQCTLTEYEKRFTQDEFIAFAVEASEEPPAEVVDITLACLSEIDFGG